MIYNPAYTYKFQLKTTHIGHKVFEIVTIYECIFDVSDTSFASKLMYVTVAQQIRRKPNDFKLDIMTFTLIRKVFKQTSLSQKLYVR